MTDRSQPGSATGAPYCATTGTLMTHLEPGFSVTELRPGADVTDRAGLFLPGVAAAVADSALGAAVYSLVGPQRVTQTVALRLDTVPGVVGRSDRVAARGTAVHVGRTTALSRGEILDGEGNVRALATCRCVVRPAAEGEYAALAGATGADPALLEPSPESPRSAAEVTTPAGLDSFLSTGLVRRLDLSVETVGGSAVATRFPTAGGLTNMYGIVHGGAVALFCDVAIAVALHALLPAGTGFVPLDFEVNFLRPVPADAQVMGEAEIVHDGRRFPVVRAQLRNPDGRVAALASSTVFVDR